MTWLLRLPTRRPYTCAWWLSIAVLLCVSVGWVSLALGVLYLTAGLGLLALTRITDEVTTVHRLVNSQHDDLVDRVAQLTAALTRNEIEVPHDPSTPRRKPHR